MTTVTEAQADVNAGTRVVYLDNNATTPCAAEVVAAMLPFFRGKHGNPSSVHVLGVEAARAIATARESIAESIGADPEDVCFTSGATEANNLVILGITHSRSNRRKIVISSIEHKSVLGPCDSLADRGYDVVTIPVTSGGIIDLDAARTLVDDRTLMVSVQGANNETGTLQPTEALAEMAHERGAAFHCDAAQMLGKVPIALGDSCLDFVSFSSHKAYGPKGIGFLVARNHIRDVALSPICFGGGQEKGLRPGTLNVPSIVGTGEACRLCKCLLTDDARRIASLRQTLEDSLRRLIPQAVVVASSSPRLPGTTSITFPGVPGDLLIARTPTVCMSMGSACTSGSLAPSHVLLAMGLSRDEASSTVRLSLGRYTTPDDIDMAVGAISQTIRSIG